MPKLGDVREDGFIFYGGRFMRPAAVSNLQARSRAYSKHNRVSANSGATKCDAGQAGEHLVAADLLTRQLHVTKPLNTNGPHDLHAETSRGWVTIQVKSGTLNVRTGFLSFHTAWRKILSDVLALTYTPRKLVRYIPRPGTTLPPELEDRDAAL